MRAFGSAQAGKRLARTHLRAVAILVASIAIGCGVPEPRAPRRAVSPEQGRTDELLRLNATLASDPDLATAYATINARYFDSRLPPVRIRWERRLEEIGPLIAEGFRLEGVTDGDVILLHPSLEESQRQLQAVLCHEMVHVALRDAADPHGAEFQARLRALAEKGAFEGLPATDEEKQQLKASLEQRAARLAGELNELTQLRTRLEADAPAMAREVLQDRTWEFNTRVRRHNQDADEFNRLVEQYNRMITYPDGLDRERLMRRPAVAVR